MTNLEYSDYHKFIVSLGLGLIIISLSIPWLFLKEPFDLFVENVDLEYLTDTSKTILDQREIILMHIFKIIPIISIMLFIAGIFLIGYGLFRWKDKQQIKDEKEKLSLEKTKKELKDMTIDEKMIDLEKEDKCFFIGNSNNILSQRKNKEDSFHVKSSQYFSSNSSYFIQEAFRSQKLLAQKLRLYFGDMYSVLTDKKLINSSSKQNYDIVMISNNKKNKDIIIEFKYYSRQFQIGNLLQAVTQVEMSEERYIENLKREVKSIVVAVVSDNIITKENKKQVEEIDEKYNGKIKILTEDELEKLDHNEIELIIQ